MSVTFNTPIRVFKRNNPTNDGTIAPDNTGATELTQQQFIAPITATRLAGVVDTFKLGTTTATPLVVPAGSILHYLYFYQTSAPSALTGGVITASINGVDIASVTPTTAGGRINMSFVNSAEVAALTANVGTSDVTIVFTATAITAITGTLAGTFDVRYTARNPDGSIIAQGAGYTNN